MYSYDQVLRALRDEGLKVIEVPGSRTRCRCHNGSHAKGGRMARPFAPSGDVMVHITAGGLGSRTALRYIADIINGDPNTPTKSQFVTDPDGVVYFNSVGRCNHAGAVGSGSIRASRRQELSTDGYVASLRGGDADGNTEWYGIENIAASTMTDAQRDSSVRICAAMSRMAGRSGRGTIGHGEASSNRAYADPNLDMGRFRRDVMSRVKAGPSGNPNQEDDMPSAKEIFDAVWHGGKLSAISPKEDYGRPAESPARRLVAACDRAGRAMVIGRRNAADIAGLKAAVKALGKAQGLSEAQVEKILTDATAKALKDVTITLSVDSESTDQ